MKPAGIARMRPVMANTDIRRPALPADWLKASIKRESTGGTLNWFNGAAILVRRTITRMNHGDRRRLFRRIVKTAWIRFESQYLLGGKNVYYHGKMNPSIIFA
jgi:hypothetical protein